MRKIIGVAVSCLVVCSLFLTVQPAFGSTQYIYSGAWEYTDTGSNSTVSFERSEDVSYDGTGSFEIYEWLYEQYYK